MFEKKVFQKQIRDLRKARGVSQSHLAAAVGLTQTMIAMIETGKRAVSVEVLVALADYFNVSLDYLVGRSDNPKRR